MVQKIPVKFKLQEKTALSAASSLAPASLSRVLRRRAMRQAQEARTCAMTLSFQAFQGV
jgi:hypothetical protein